jgi:hypothetical protein
LLKFYDCSINRKKFKTSGKRLTFAFESGGQILDLKAVPATGTACAGALFPLLII